MDAYLDNINCVKLISNVVHLRLPNCVSRRKRGSDVTDVVASKPAKVSKYKEDVFSVGVKLCLCK